MARPLKFKTVEELEKAIEEYFESCDSRTKPVLVKEKDGAYFIDAPFPKPYTIEGLASFLGVDRHTINNYEDRDEFFTTIKKAKDKILANLVERSLDGDNNATTTIFNLKNNYGYEDKTAQEISGKGGAPLGINVVISGNDNPITTEPVDDESDTGI